MTARRTHAHLFFAFVLAVVALGVWAAPASAFHFPWDQGHDIFDPDQGDDDTDPGDDEPCLFGSPFEPASGNFLWEERDLLIPGPGPYLNLTRHYNSHDLRSGPFGLGWSFTFDRRLVLTTDGSASFAICQSPSGRRVRFVRNADGSFSPPKNTYDSLVENPDGTFVLRRRFGTEYRFDSAGALLTVVDRNGNSLTFEYDSTGFLNRISDDSGRSLQFAKGANGKVADVVDPLGRVYSYSYDARGNLVSYQNPEGHTTTYLYTTKDELREVRDGNGQMMQRVTYDAEGRVASYVEEAETWTVRYFVDRTTKTDSQNRVWTIWFNADGSIIRKRDPSGGEEHFEYDGNLNVVRYTDKRGNSTRFTYDGLGNITSFTDPRGGVTTLTYEPNFNRLTSLTDPLGATTTYEYDVDGNLLQLTDPVGDTIQFTYTSRGQRSSYTDGVGDTTTYAYDAAGNLIQVTDSLGQPSTFSYDAAGRIVSAVDRSGAITTYEYDALDRPVRIFDALGNTTAYAYDAAGNLVSVTDALGRSTEYAYDVFDRLIRREDPLGLAETFSYDVKGNVTGHLARSGRTTTYVYDALSRLVRKTTVDNDITFAYDAQDNVTAVQDLDSAVFYTYDALNRVATVTSRALFGGQPEVTQTYVYDAASRLASLSDSLGGQVGYARDAAGRLTAATTPSGQTIDLAYDGRGRLRQIVYPNGVVTDYAVDGAGRLGGVTTGFPGGPQMASLQYAYDPNDRVVTLTRDGLPTSLSYDPLRQVTAAVGSSGESYSYDAVGNRFASHLSAGYSHDAANRLLEDDDFTYSYDADGNLSRRTAKNGGAVTSYSFDGENRLVRIDHPDGSTSSYRYDGWGRRVAKEVGGLVTRYVYSFSDIALELDGTGVVAARYTHGDRLDQPLSMERAGSDYYFHSDGLGSIRLVTDVAGTVQNSYDYDAFGNFTERIEAVTSPYGFTGREYDAESGLYFYRARYYSPQLGRFLSEDPVGFAGRDVNLYRYVWNDPLNHTDPSGLIPLDTLWDLANVIYDIVTGDCEALALDLAAMAIPYLPAGITKIDDAVRLGDKALDVTRRPKNFRKKTIQDDWDNAANGSKPGTKACPTCGKDVEVAPGQGPRDWDVDHQPPWSQRDLDGMTRQEVLDEYNRGTRLECPSCNRGRGATPANDP